MPTKTPSPPSRQGVSVATIHPTVLSVLYLLYHLPAVRRAVWECDTIPEVSKTTPPVELQPHKFVRVLQQLFLKIQRNEPWSQADMQWSQKIVGIPGHVCFDICRNYMVGLLLTAIPELDDLFSYTCEHEYQYPDIGTVEVREAPDIPLTFGTPAHENVMMELQDAGQMGHGSIQQVKIVEEMSQEVRDKWAEHGLGEGDVVLRATRCRYDQENFPDIFVLDRWTIHPCAPVKTKRGDAMCVRVSPHPQIRPPAEIDMTPFFPWPFNGQDEIGPLKYTLYSVTALRGYDWAENFAEGIEVQGNVMTSMGMFNVYINENMNGEWLEVGGREVRHVSWGEMGTILLAPNAMVTSYTYIAHDKIPTLFPPPSTIEIPPLIQARQCANPSCNAAATPGSAHPRCSRCHLVGYCTTDCQKAHWKVHKVVCSSTTCLDDVYVPPEPPVTVRPPFGRHCNVCIPLMVKREHEWLSKQSMEQLIQFAHATKAPLPKSKAKLQKMTPADLADLLIEHTHPGFLKKKKEKKAEITEGNEGEEGQEDAQEEEPDEEEDADEDEQIFDEPIPANAIAPRRALSASESAMQSYALPVIIAMLAILVAFSWLG